MQFEREERKPDPRGVAVDLMNLSDQGLDGVTRFGDVLTKKMGIERLHS